MRLSRIAFVLSLAALLTPAVFAQARAVPGTVNYVEGTASINGRAIHPHAIGSEAVREGQFLSTDQKSRAEMLLTPGTFLRLGHGSSLQMISPDLTRTQVRLTEGKAMIEVLQLFKENMLLVTEDGVTTRIVKPGLYEFDAHAGIVRTFDGRALAFVRPNDPHHPVVVRTSHEFLIPPQAASGSVPPSVKLKAQHFDRKQEETTDALYGWSSLRARYLAQANISLAYQYAGYGGFNPGWYWNPYLWGYTWMPGGGMFWDPFGWGFYSPWWVYGGYPIYGGGYYGGGYYGRGGYIPPYNNAHGNFGPGHNFTGGPRPAFGTGRSGGPMPAFNGGGFHAGAVGGGGFHGGAIGGGGFHAGGGGIHH
ncbi:MULTISPECIES: hypothetical protein [Acidobacterium]|nr:MULTISPECIES: hypothetical protein [Acidobacterium]